VKVVTVKIVVVFQLIETMFAPSHAVPRSRLWTCVEIRFWSRMMRPSRLLNVPEVMENVWAAPLAPLCGTVTVSRTGPGGVHDLRGAARRDRRHGRSG
jgi:hypothetical protein